MSSDRAPAPSGVGVVIVNYRTPALTLAAATSALEDDARSVVIVDNDSRDDTLAVLETITDPRVRVLANDRNAGFGSAANIGAAAADGDVIVFLNSDARVRRGALRGMAAAVRAADGRAIIGPRLVGEDGVIQRSAGLVPKPDDLAVRGLGIHRVGKMLWRVPGLGRLRRGRIATEYEQASTATTTIEVSMVSGACMAVGRAAFHELGGFDERYFMYFEDADLCRRASRAGWPIRYVPDAIVDHIGGASAPGDYRFGPWHAASMIRYLRDWHGRAGAAIGLAILGIRAIGHAVALRPNAGSAMKALRMGLATARGRT